MGVGTYVLTLFGLAFLALWSIYEILGGIPLTIIITLAVLMMVISDAN